MSSIDEKITNEPGTYMITNEATEKAYFGASGDLNYRRYSHLYALKTNTHSNPNLQEFYNDNDGKLLFLGVPLNNKEEAYDLEQILIDEFYESGLILNIAKYAKQSYRGLPISEETRNKISERMKGNKHSLGHKHSEETKRKISEANKGKQPGLGKIPSKETRRKISEANKLREPRSGHKHSEESKRLMSEIRKGIVFTEEHKENIRKARAIPVSVNGTVYESTDEAMEKLNLTRRIVNYRRKSDNFPEWQEVIK